MKNDIKKIIAASIVCLCVYSAGCSSEDNNSNPVSDRPKDISWMRLGLDSCLVSSIFFTSDGNILAGTNYGLYVSSDKGKTWKILNQEISDGTVNTFSRHPDGFIFAGSAKNGFYISSDNGANWQNTGLMKLNVTSIAINSRGKIFACTRGNGIFVSAGNFNKWMPAATDHNKTFSSLLVSIGGLIFAGGDGIFRSGDDGETWVQKNNGLGNWPVFCLISDQKGNIYAGTDIGGFFESTDDGELWMQLNNGLTNTEITSLAVNADGYIFSGTWGGGVFRTTDNGRNWSAVDSGLTVKQISVLAFSPDNYLYTGTFKGIFIASEQ